MMKRHLASVSPWILAAACTLLTFIIGAFAVTNYNREKELMTEALVQKGLSVIRFLDTGVRVSMRAGWQGRRDMSTQSAVDWVDHVQEVINQLQEQSDIHFVELLDSSGVVLAATDSKRVGRKYDTDLEEFVQKSIGGDYVFRMHREGSKQGFQIARVFTPRLRGAFPGNPQNMRMPAHMHRGGNDAGSTPALPGAVNKGFAIVVELDLEAFDNAVARQLWQIVILSVVLLLVGVGGWLSLLTLQGFRGTQNRLQRVRAFNDMLVGSLPIGLIATNSDGDVQIVNEAAERISGIKAESLLNRKIEQVLPEELYQNFLEHSGEDSHLGARSAEREIQFADGQKRALLLTALTVADSQGEFSGDVLLLQDISELRKLEGELRRTERLAALGKMAAGVAHELRNPLSSIKGLALLLKGKVPEDERGKETADILVQEVERLNRSIGELLDYARPGQLQFTAVRLSDVLNKAISLVAVDAEAMSIKLTTDLPESGDLIKLDEDKINQVFLNLLLNAIQAMPDGGELTITMATEAAGVGCEIEDSGIGVAEENLSKVFDPYFTTKSDGTGLGLALSAKIVEEHGGTITMSSGEGEGTCVKLFFPFKND